MTARKFRHRHTTRVHISKQLEF